MTQAEQIHAAMTLVGTNDFDAKKGVVIIDGEFALAVVNIFVSGDMMPHSCAGQAVRIQRLDDLDLWCDGYFFAHSCIGDIVHTAANTLGQNMSGATV